MYEQDTLLPMAESLHPLQAEQPMLQANTRALQFCFQTEQLELACTEMCDDYISGFASVQLFLGGAVSWVIIMLWLVWQVHSPAPAMTWIVSNMESV